MKKIIIIIIAVLVLAGIAVYIFVIPKPEPEPDISYYTPGDFFVTNVKDSTRLLKVTIVLELATVEDQTAYLTEHNHILRDIIVFKLREKSEEELRSLDIDTALREEIIKALETEMGIDYITNVYFNDYVLQ